MAITDHTWQRNNSLKTLQAAVAEAGFVHSHASYSKMISMFGLDSSATMITSFRKPEDRLDSHFRFHFGKGQAYVNGLMRAGGEAAVVKAHAEFVETQGPTQGRIIAP